jgi:hypothetical protein
MIEGHAMIETEFYTAAEAAEWLGNNCAGKRTIQSVLTQVKRYALPIYFHAETSLTGACVRKPDGTEETLTNLVPYKGTIEEIDLKNLTIQNIQTPNSKVDQAIPFNGTLKSLFPPGHRDSLEATHVQVIRFDDVPFINGSQPITKYLDSRIDDIEIIKIGYEVTGWVFFLEVPLCDWLFSIDDLQKLVDCEASPATKAWKQKLPSQETAILKWIKTNGYDPLKLPVPPPGKSGVKKECKNEVCKDMDLFLSATVFRTAWERLRYNREIVDAV